MEREATYRADSPTPAGLFVYQFETISRNRLGYDDGLIAMQGDPLYDEAWRGYFEQVRRRVGSVDSPTLSICRTSRPARVRASV